MSASKRADLAAMPAITSRCSNEESAMGDSQAIEARLGPCPTWQEFFLAAYITYVR